jgi:hypothetical protein
VVFDVKLDVAPALDSIARIRAISGRYRAAENGALRVVLGERKS